MVSVYHDRGGGLTMTFPDSNHLTQQWTLFEQGRATGTTTMSLTRAP
jgi:hypothetical protein